VKHLIRRFEPLQVAKISAVIYGFMGLLFAPIFIFASMMAPNSPGFGIGFAIALPIIYAVIGFIGTAIAAAIYNLAAGWVGGIVVEVEAVSPTSP